MEERSKFGTDWINTAGPHKQRIAKKAPLRRTSCSGATNCWRPARVTDVLGKFGEFDVSLLAASPALVAAPKLITISDDRGYMRLTFSDGEDIELRADHIRTACKCAYCTRARIDGVFPERFDDVTINEFSFMGGYAINIAFSDGHTRGIYPWAFLIGLATSAPDIQD